MKLRTLLHKFPSDNFHLRFTQLIQIIDQLIKSDKYFMKDRTFYAFYSIGTNDTKSWNCARRITGYEDWIFRNAIWVIAFFVTGQRHNMKHTKLAI